jgi:hypothetical protein
MPCRRAHSTNFTAPGYHAYVWQWLARSRAAVVTPSTGEGVGSTLISRSQATAVRGDFQNDVAEHVRVAYCVQERH